MRKKANFSVGNSGEKKSKLKDFKFKKQNDSKTHLQLKQIMNIFQFNKKKIEDEKKKFEDKKEVIRKEIIQRKSIWNQMRGIRVTILGAIFVPVLLMAIFGVFSYKKSSDAIIERYEQSTTDTLSAVSDFMDLGLKNVQEKTIEMLLNDDVVGYFRGKREKDTIDDITAFRGLKEIALVSKETNQFITGVHMFAGVGNAVTTSTLTPPKDFHAKFMESTAGQYVIDKADRNIWAGSHEAIDEMLQIDPESYSMYLISKMTSNKGFIVMDISKEKIISVLSDINAGEGSIIGFITPDGKETLTDSELQNVFINEDYFKTSLESEDESGFSYQTYNKEEYLYIYSKVGNTGAVVTALVPKSIILKQAHEIRTLNFVFVLVASVLAIVIGLIIASGIGNAISKLMKSISMAARGDLTADFNTKRKDEFLVLSNSLSDMMSSMRNLIGEVAEVGTKVSGSAGQLSATSEEILGATKDISRTIDEIEKGVVQQASDTDHCLGQMSNLSDKINQVYGSTYEIEKIANNTKGVVGEGLVIIDELNNKSKATSDVTNTVIREIEELEVHSRTIGNFVGIINEIAAQTNLLSLNASIEAARAGDAGRGFAVVADEIRKLADQSMKAASQIQGIVTEIQGKTKGTVVSAKQAEDIVDSQTEALHKTIKVFEDINNRVNDLVENLDNISIGVKGIESAKEDTLDAIRNISAVSQQSAAASEEVSATANNQIGSVESLSESALDLANDAKKLEKAIQLFRIK
jgi:methyl-accepting chemotaxis protein